MFHFLGVPCFLENVENARNDNIKNHRNRKNENDQITDL